MAIREINSRNGGLTNAESDLEPARPGRLEGG
jgi:hypothetical protein